jgi:hypothetical protein
MSRLPMRPPSLGTIPLALLINAGLTGTASAHVKWFCAYNVAGQPLGLENVLCPDFEMLVCISIAWLFFGSVVEWSFIGNAMLRAINRATQFVEENTELIFRIGCAFFFVSIWAIGGIILTPELKTNATWIGAVQLAIAAGMMSRRTMPLSGIGIFVLFDYALWNYGAFHLADYPIFLGVATYVALKGAQTNFFGARPIDVVRWAAGITLMWASVEKWAYPEWSFPLFIQHPNLTLGFTPEFYMRAAGAVEFALAFALMWTPLVRRVAAILLTGAFIGAVFDFGKLDLIGHTLIVVVLVGIVADSGREIVLTRRPWLVPVAYVSALSVFLTTYYLAHAALYGTSLT